MAHTHEYDCVVCGAHFDDERSLQRHNQEQHAPKQAIDPREPAEPMGTEHARHHEGDQSRNDDRGRRDGHNPPYTKTNGFAAPKFGSAGSGGAEYEPGPERD